MHAVTDALRSDVHLIKPSEMPDGCEFNVLKALLDKEYTLKIHS